MYLCFSTKINKNILTRNTRTEHKIGLTIYRWKANIKVFHGQIFIYSLIFFLLLRK